MKLKYGFHNIPSNTPTFLKISRKSTSITDSVNNLPPESYIGGNISRNLELASNNHDGSPDVFQEFNKGYSFTTQNIKSHDPVLNDTLFTPPLHVHADSLFISTN